MIRFEQDPSSLPYLCVNGQEHALRHRPLRLALPQIWQEPGFNPIRTLHQVTQTHSQNVTKVD